MKISNKLGALLSVVLFSTFAFGMSTKAQATALDVGAWDGSDGCCSARTRGYWFTAPTDFFITGLSVPTNGPGNGATLEVLRFNAGAPPEFSNNTNDFTSLGYWTDTTSVITNLAINAGDIIGVLGWADGKTPYRDTEGPYATSLGGFDITLTRLGFQNLGQASNVWSEASGSIGVIGLEYELNSVPEPAPLALLGLGLAGLVLARKQAKA